MDRWLPGSPQQVHHQALVVLSLAIALIFVFALALFFWTLILRRRNRMKGEIWAALEARWRDQLLDLLAEGGSRQPLLRSVQKGQELYFVDFLLRYAKQLRGSEMDLVAELARPHLGTIARYVGDREAERRARAVYTLGVIALRQHETRARFAPLVVRALDDPAPLVGMVALRALARPECLAYLPALLPRLAHFQMMDRRFLVSVLAGVGGEAGSDLRVLMGNRRAALWDRSLAADVLAELHDVEAGDAAAQILAEETDRELLAALLRLLAGIGRPEHLPAVRALAGASDFVVRAHVATALGRLGGSGEHALLRRLFDDESNWVAHRAALALQEAGGEALLQEAAGSPHPRAEMARQALAEATR